MKKTLFLFLFALTFYTCQSQTGKSKKHSELAHANKPKTNIEVHKQFDKNGNLISVDSTYSSFYSNIKNDTIAEKKMYQQFRSEFSKHFKSLDSNFMNDFFDAPTMNMNDFYTDNFFKDHFKTAQLDKLIKEMDSIKNNFYQRQSKSINKKN